MASNPLLKNTETVKENKQSITMENTDFEVRSLDAAYESELNYPWWHNLAYLFAGLLFGIVLVKGEVISWFRIQEMFRLQSFHMYGIIGSAVVVGIISVWMIKKFKVKTIYGEPIKLLPKNFTKDRSMEVCCSDLDGLLRELVPGHSLHRSERAQL